MLDGSLTAYHRAAAVTWHFYVSLVSVLIGLTGLHRPL
jgi:hypothetical protein